jgi:SNF2 family DNA or RNA helicase
VSGNREGGLANGADFFLLSLKAGGSGLNLIGADAVIHLDPRWNPAVEDQATDRTHRIGQQRPMTAIRLIAQGTIEEAVIALHEGKRALADGLLAGTEAAGKLSAAELVDLIRFGSRASLFRHANSNIHM